MSKTGKNPLTGRKLSKQDRRLCQDQFIDEIGPGIGMTMTSMVLAPHLGSLARHGGKKLNSLATKGSKKGGRQVGNVLKNVDDAPQVGTSKLGDKKKVTQELLRKGKDGPKISGNKGMKPTGDDLISNDPPLMSKLPETNTPKVPKQVDGPVKTPSNRDAELITANSKVTVRRSA